MRKTAIRIAIFLGFVGLSLTLVQYYFARSKEALARHAAARLDALGDRQVADLIAQWPKLGDEGIVRLVDALASSRQAVVDAAQATLQAELVRWRDESEPARSRQAARLAHLLAGQRDQFSPAVLSFTAEMAEELLDWPIDSRAIRGFDLVADCESLLRAAHRSAVRRQPSDRGRSDAPLDYVIGSDPPLALPGGGLIPDPAPGELPGGGGTGLTQRSPLRTLARPGLARQLEPVPAEHSEQPSAPTASEPGEFNPQIGQRLTRPARPLAAPKEPEDSRGGTSPEGGPAVPPTGERREEADGLIAPAAGDTSLPLTLLTERALMDRLHWPQTAVASAARRELARRGFSAVDFDRAQRLTDPDPQVRKELAEELSDNQPGDVRRWLFELARDAAADVRLAAITRLLTCPDPELHARLAERTRGETDPRIRAALDRRR